MATHGSVLPFDPEKEEWSANMSSMLTIIKWQMELLTIMILKRCPY